MKRSTFLIFLLFPFLLQHSQAFPNSKFPKKMQGFSSSLLPWIENKGQMGEDISFYTKTSGANLYLTKSGEILYKFNLDQSTPYLLKESFLDGHMETGKPVGLNQTSTQLNLLKGGGSAHLKGIPNYTHLDMGEIWEGIHLKLTCTGDNVEKIFTLLPGSNPAQINIQFSEELEICQNEEMELQLDTRYGPFCFTRPIAWQMINETRIDVPVSYLIRQNGEQYSYGFSIDKYNPKFPVYIDPLLGSSYFGEDNYEGISFLELDQNNKVFIGGTTNSFDIPVTDQAFDNSFNGDETYVYSDSDIFIARLSSDLTMIESCTYLGGELDDGIFGMELSTEGNVYIAGSTWSTDYPTTPNAYSQTYSGGQGSTIDSYGEGIISLLSNDLSTLISSTYFGGEGTDYCRTLVLDSQNNLYISGQSSSNLPWKGPQITNHSTGVYFLKMNPGLSQILALNSLGYGSIFMGTNASCLDAAGNYIVVGTTIAFEGDVFPSTPGSFSEHLNGADDGFIIKLSPDLSQNLAASYIGGSDDEYITGVTCDANNHIYVSGGSSSTDFGIACFDENSKSALLDPGGFILKFNALISDVMASVSYGEKTIPGKMAFDPMGDIFVIGTTSDYSFPVSCNSIDNYPRYSEALVMKIKASLDEIVIATYFGGNENDGCSDFEQDLLGNIYITGTTNSTDLPLLNAFDNTNTGTYYSNKHYDGYIAKITPDLINYTPCCSYITEPVWTAVDVPCEVEFKWIEAMYADGYKLSIGSSPGKKDILEDMDVGNVLSYNYAYLPNHDTLYVQIDAYNEFGIATGKECYQTYFYTADSKFAYEEKTICQGDFYYWEGFEMRQEGRYEVLHYGANGCDSIIHLDLNVVPCFFQSDTVTLCGSDPVFWHGEFYDTPGSYFDYLTTIYGGDSTYQLVILDCDPLLLGSDQATNGSPNFILYPNPVVDGFLNIAWNENPSPYQLNILDKTGRLCYQRTLGQKNNRINLRELKPGLYLLQLTMNNKHFEKKILLQ